MKKCRPFFLYLRSAETPATEIESPYYLILAMETVRKDPQNITNEVSDSRCFALLMGYYDLKFVE